MNTICTYLRISLNTRKKRIVLIVEMAASSRPSGECARNSSRLDGQLQQLGSKSLSCYNTPPPMC